MLTDSSGTLIEQKHSEGSAYSPQINLLVQLTSLIVDLYLQRQIFHYITWCLLSFGTLEGNQQGCIFNFNSQLEVIDRNERYCNTQHVVSRPCPYRIAGPPGLSTPNTDLVSAFHS